MHGCVVCTCTCTRRVRSGAPYADAAKRMYPGLLCIVQADITDTDKPTYVEFTYSVSWHEDETPFSERMNKLAGGGLLPSTFEVMFCLVLSFVCGSAGELLSSSFEWVIFLFCFVLGFVS